MILLSKGKSYMCPKKVFRLGIYFCCVLIFILFGLIQKDSSKSQ